MLCNLKYIEKIKIIMSTHLKAHVKPQSSLDLYPNHNFNTSHNPKNISTCYTYNSATTMRHF